MATAAAGPLSQSKRVLELYRTLLRIGKAMPTETRSALVLFRVKADFRANSAETDPQQIEHMIQLAEVQVDNLEVLVVGIRTRIGCTARGFFYRLLRVLLTVPLPFNCLMILDPERPSYRAGQESQLDYPGRHPQKHKAEDIKVHEGTAL